MSFTDAQIAEFRAILEKQYGREFTRLHALDTLTRVTKLIKSVSRAHNKPSSEGGHGELGGF
jgi:hypothetical protein